MEAIFEEDLNGPIDYEKYCWNVQDPSEKVFRHISKRLKKAAKLKRRQRHAEMELVTKYFDGVRNPEWIAKLDDFMDQVLDTVAVICELSFRLLEEGDDIYQCTSDFSTNVEILLEHLQETLNADNFVNQTSKLYKFCLDLAINNPNSWKHMLVTNAPMELISLACTSVENKDFVADSFKSQMLEIHKPITSCGDFECQRSLLVCLICWLMHITPDLKSTFLRNCFTLLPRQFRKMLLRDFSVYDVDYKTRYFLNALNKELSKSHRPSSILSLPCSNVFLDGEVVKLAHHLDIRDFWIDFSCKSKRIHFYSSCSNENDWRNNSFRKDEVESICIFYPASESQNGEFLCCSQMTSQLSQRTITSSVSYVHFLLTEGIDNFSVFSEASTCTGRISLVFEFTNMEKVEAALEYFGFETHECDEEDCKLLVPRIQDVESVLRSQLIQTAAPPAMDVDISDHESMEESQALDTGAERTVIEKNVMELSPVRNDSEEVRQNDSPAISDSEEPHTQLPAIQFQPIKTTPLKKNDNDQKRIPSWSEDLWTSPELADKLLPPTLKQPPLSALQFQQTPTPIQKSGRKNVPSWRKEPSTSPEPEPADKLSPPTLKQPQLSAFQFQPIKVSILKKKDEKRVPSWSEDLSTSPESDPADKLLPPTLPQPQPQLATFQFKPIKTTPLNKNDKKRVPCRKKEPSTSRGPEPVHKPLPPTLKQPTLSAFQFQPIKASTLKKNDRKRVPCWRKEPSTSPEPEPLDPYDLDAAIKIQQAKAKKKKQRLNIR